MEGETPQVPVTQEAQPEVKSIPQTPQQPPVVPQTAPRLNLPPKLKKLLKSKILIILIALVCLVAGGYFIYKNILQPETEKRETGSDSVETSGITKAGRLERDETWSGQINVTGDILVEEGVTLTILPGTQITISAGKDTQNLFGHGECDGIKDYDLLSGKREERSESCGVQQGEPYRDEGNRISIHIYGTLHAVGTPEQMITITSDSPTPGIYDWNFFNFDKGVLSYCIMEYYRCFNPGNDTIVSHNILRHAGECAACFFSGQSTLVEYNSISYAGHELIGMYNSSPVIHNNIIGPNPDGSCITIDGGFPQITDNTIKNCGGGISLLVPPSDTKFEDSVLRDNTFLHNSNDIWHAY